MQPPQLVAVLEQVEPGGLRWRVMAGWTSDNELMTTVNVDGPTGAQPVGGFAGPPVWDGHLINYWYGQATDTPAFVVVRSRREVRTVGMQAGDGPAVEISMSGVIPGIGLRFGAACLGTDVDLQSRPSFTVLARTDS